MKKLVRYAALVGSRNASGMTPLHFALGAGKLKVTSFLLEKGADVNHAGERERRVLDCKWRGPIVMAGWMGGGWSGVGLTEASASSGAQLKQPYF